MGGRKRHKRLCGALPHQPKPRQQAAWANRDETLMESRPLAVNYAAYLADV
jgi:hypothetical protein